MRDIRYQVKPKDWRRLLRNRWNDHGWALYEAIRSIVWGQGPARPGPGAPLGRGSGSTGYLGKAPDSATTHSVGRDLVVTDTTVLEAVGVRGDRIRQPHLVHDADVQRRQHARHAQVEEMTVTCRFSGGMFAGSRT